MATVALRAHYDGERIVLDEPFPLPLNTPLLVTVLAASRQDEADSEEVWLNAASNAFNFLNDPAEDIYTPEDGEPFHHAV